MIETWDSYHLGKLDSIKRKSKDPSTKVGAIITGKNNQVISEGFNGFPININDNLEKMSYRYERPLKYKLTLHAEHNAILLHSRNGGCSLEGCTLYSSLHPCVACATAIIQVGITRVVTFSQSEDDLERLSKDFDFCLSKELFSEAGVTVVEYDKRLIYD